MLMTSLVINVFMWMNVRIPHRQSGAASEIDFFFLK